MTFSIDSYRKLIGAALEAGYRPAAFDPRGLRDHEFALRHDVDYSVEMAVELGRVNAELGVAGTFFILLRGHSYNPLSKTSLQRLHELVSLGQRLGLHASAGSEAELARDFEYLADEVPLHPVVSWHNPTSELIDSHRGEETIAELVNVYSKPFLDDALYRSDSNFGRTYADLVASFETGGRPVHLLVHPINWVTGGASMIEVFERAWPYLIRECEQEARTNRVYSDALPNGMAGSLLVDFGRRWRESVK